MWLGVVGLHACLGPPCGPCHHLSFPLCRLVQNDMDLGEIQGVQPALYQRYNVVNEDDEDDDEDEEDTGWVGLLMAGLVHLTSNKCPVFVCMCMSRRARIPGPRSTEACEAPWG